MPIKIRCQQCSTLGLVSPCRPCRMARKQRRNADRAVARLVVADATHCAICGRPPTADDPLTLDHVVALAHGGGSERANLQAAHRSCNSAKGARRPGGSKS